MAEAPRASTINPLNILFGELENGMDQNDVKKMKNLLRGDQLSKEEMEKLESASDVFHHLKDNGDIGVNNLGLLVQLFTTLGKDPLKRKVEEFQREHASTTDTCKASKQTSSKVLKGKANLVILNANGEEEELTELQGKIKNKIYEVASQHWEMVKELFVKNEDPAKFRELRKCFKQTKACLVDIAPGCLLFTLSFSTKDNVEFFWQKYKDNTVETAITDILISPDIREEAIKSGFTVRIRMKIDEGEYDKVKESLQEVQWCRSPSYDKWEKYVVDRKQDSYRALDLLQQSRFDPVVDTLRQEEYFFHAIVSFWFQNSCTLPPTVTKATECAVTQHTETYCKENNVKVENLRELGKARFNEIGKYLYENINEENVGKIYPFWIDKSIPNLESHLFGLLTKSEEFYTFQSNYMYSYIIAVYLSNMIALSPDSISQLIREERMKTVQANLPYCFPYITGLLGDEASCFLKEIATFSSMQTYVDIDNLELVGNCLFESGRSSVFARDIEKVVGQNHTLDLSTCKDISNHSIHALSVILEYTSLIKDIKLYSEIDEALLSSEFKECLTNIMGDPLAVDRCKARINNSHDFTVTARLLRILPLLCKHAKARSGSDTTLQPVITSLTISSDVSISEEIHTFAMEMLIKAFSCLPHFENLSLTGLGAKLCEQFLLCLSKETVSLNIKTLCLAGNDLSWKHCRLLLEALNVLPCLTILDLSRKSIDSLGCTVLLPIQDKIYVSVDENNIAHELLEILASCTSREQLQIAGLNTLVSLDEVASLMKSLESVRHIDCTKLSNSQFEKLCQNLSLLRNIVNIDLSGVELNQQIVMLLRERLSHLKELRKLDLSRCVVSRCDMKVLLQNISPDVTDLNLSATNKSGLLLDNLKHFENLKHLNLSKNNLNSYDLVFENIPMRVTYLNLSHNKLHEESVKTLKTLTKLAELDVSYNKLKSSDIQSILKAISTSLTALNVSHNNLEETHGEKLTTLDFKHLTNLVRLDLSHTNLRLSMHSPLSSISQNLEYLDVGSNKIDNADKLGELISDFQFSKLCQINMSSNSLGAVGVKKLLSDIESYNTNCDIDVSHNLSGLQKLMPNITIKPPILVNVPVFEKENLTIKDEHLQVFFKNTSRVTAVEVPKNVEWSDTDYKNVLNDLSVFSNLEILTVPSLRPTTCPYLANILKNFSHLRHLDISGSNINSKSVEAIGNSLLLLERLQYVNFSNTKIDMKGVVILLNIQRMHVSKPFINVANNIHNLKAIFPYIKDQLSGSSLIGDIDFDSDELPVQTFANLEQMAKLKTLTVKEKQWVKKDFKCFVQWLHYLNLEYLDLSQSNIGDVSAKTLSEVMRSMDGLTHLDLSHNNMGDSGAKSLSERMRSMDELTHLDLSHNNMGDSGTKSLSEGMRSLDRLARLDLSHNNIGDSGAHSLSEGMRSMDRITYLDVSHNNIGDSGAMSLGEGMGSMHGLSYLDLSYNDIEDSGAWKLSKGMRSMHGLTHLDLSHNNIRDSGAMFLSEGMRSMGGLTQLDLSHNDIGDSGAESLSTGMKSMDQLTHLNLSHNCIGDMVQKV